jgi:DGQHR domain-containing protein
MPTIYCLRQEISSGSKTYPIFVGFLDAELIMSIAEAPHFTETTSNEEIASKLDVPPIKDWQRPLIPEKLTSIASLFSDTGEFMPNPVLLSENVLSTTSSDISAKQQITPGGMSTMVWEIDIPISRPSRAKPLWILDGQHRITGMAQSKQRKDQVPVVLLINLKGNYYDGSDLAKIFAQVTTQATKLDALHNEWLTYAFDLDAYSISNPKYSQHRDAMKCVAKLASMPKLGEKNSNNPFLNRIQFNQHYKTAIPDPGGFSYDCIDLKNQIFKHYYDAATLEPRLPPIELAIQIGLAHDALKAVVVKHSKSVFFGEESGQKIMQDAFLVGVMTHLLNHGKPNDWRDVLLTLAFDKTNWEFNWVKSLSGPAQTISRKIALDVFTVVFRDSRLPSGVSNLADYLKGDNAKVVFSFSILTETGRPSKRHQIAYELPMGGVKTAPLTLHKHVKVASFSPNIGKVTVTDSHRPLTTYKTIASSGLKLEKGMHAQPLVLTVAVQHYGDTMSSSELTVGWNDSDEQLQ